MSFKKCEKLIAPRTLKRVCGSWTRVVESTAGLSCMICPRNNAACERPDLPTLLATSLYVLPECAHEAVRALCILEGTGVALGCVGVHRRHRLDRLSRRDRAGLVRAAHPTRDNSAFFESHALAGIRCAHHVSHAGGDVLVAGFYPHLCDLGRQERACRQAPGADSRCPAVGTDFRFHFGDHRFFLV